MSTLIDLRVRPDFADACPKLMPDERKQLEANILADGIVRDPICVWHGYIIDGHYRFEIAKKHDIAFAVERLDDQLADESAVFEWIKNNALGRRNLSPDQKRVLREQSLERGRQYNAAKGPRGGDRRSKGHDDTLNVAAEIAEANGVNERTVKRDGKKAEAFDKADEQTQQQYLDGEISGAELQAASGEPKDFYRDDEREEMHRLIQSRAATSVRSKAKAARQAIEELKVEMARLSVEPEYVKIAKRHLVNAKRQITSALKVLEL
jgi:hypothetical protein